MKTVAQMLATLLLAPFGIAIGLLVFGTLGIIAIPLSVRGHFEQWKWLRKIHSSGRSLTATEILDREEIGTLIVDQPSWSGKAKYCWWTPDDLESLAPVKITSLADRKEALKFEIEPDSLPLDQWIYNEYLSDDNGKAYLVATRKGDYVAEQMLANSVSSRLTETWSAPVREFGRTTTDA